MSRRLRQQRWLEKVTSGFKSGTYVSWPASSGVAKGKVVSVHTAKVPGVVSAATATPEAPAARVQLHAKNGNAWEPTGIHIAIPTGSLTAIDALPAPEVPATEAVVAGSFEEIRIAVRDAIADRIEELTGVCPSIYLYDCGPTWAVYELNWDDDLWLVDYQLDATSGAVMLGQPVEVAKVTTYVPVEPVNGSGAMVESRERVDGRLLEAAGIAADGGRVFRVRIIAYGDSKNGRRYPEAVLRSAAAMYEGAKAYDHHRTIEELNTGTIVGLIGHYENVSAGPTGLEADLHLLPSAVHAAEALDQALVNQAAGMAPLVGISHDVLTTSKVVSDGGRQLREVTAITQVYSSDVVADPAAGGEAMRMVAALGASATNPNNNIPKKEITVNLKQLLALLRAAESAERAALLQEHAHVIESAGLTGQDAIRMAEATTTTPPAPERTVEHTLTKGSLVTSLVVEKAAESAGLSSKIAAAVLEELPAQFTEADLAAKIASVKRTIEAAALAPSVPHVDTKFDSIDKKVAALDAMLAGNFKEGYRSLKAAYVDFTGDQPKWNDTEDFNRKILRESVTLYRDGERTPFDSSLRASESVVSSTWGNVLGDSVTRRMVAEYSQPSLSTWRNIVSSIVPINDFRTQRIERLGGYGTLPTVNQGAPYQPLTSPANDTEPTYTLGKRGGTEDLTLETIANDDIRALTRIPVKLGLAAAQTVFRYVWDILNTNPNIYDSVAFFAAGHNNTAATALSGGNLSLARKAMRKQAAYGDAANLLSIVPKFLVTCSDLEELAWELCTSAVAMPSGAPVGAATNIPNIHQGLTPLVVDYWTSTTTWFTVADPSLIPTIELGFYQGKEDPELFVQNDPSVGSVFNSDKVTWKIRHIYNGAVLDFRGFYRGNS